MDGKSRSRAADVAPPLPSIFLARLLCCLQARPVLTLGNRRGVQGRLVRAGSVCSSRHNWCQEFPVRLLHCSPPDTRCC
jgi:hypothetical protein